MDSFCYAIADHQNRLSLVRKVNFPAGGLTLALPALDASHPVLLFPFHQVRIALATQQQVLVPNPLFVRGNAASYLSHADKRVEPSVVHTDFLASENAWLLYGVTSSLASWIQERFPSATLQHFHTVLLDAFHRKAQDIDYFLGAHIWHEGMVLFLFQAGRLVFQNSFSCVAADDFLYFLLLVCQQFKLRPERLPLYLSGGVAPESQIYSLLYRYFFEVRFVDFSEFLEKGKQAQHYPAHFFNDVAALLGSSN